MAYEPCGLLEFSIRKCSMVREQYRQKSSRASRIGGLLLINILPILGLAALAWGFATGRISESDVPEGLPRQAILIGIALAALIVVVSVVLPVVHGAAKGLRRQRRESAAVRENSGAARALLEWLLWPFRLIFYIVFWLLRSVCYLLGLSLIAAIIIFAVRIARPEFGEAWLPIDEWLEVAETWLRDLGD